MQSRSVREIFRRGGPAVGRLDHLLRATTGRAADGAAASRCRGAAARGGGAVSCGGAGASGAVSRRIGGADGATMASSRDADADAGPVASVRGGADALPMSGTTGSP